MKVPKTSIHWASYIDFVNSIIVRGLTRLVVVSLRKLVDMLSPEKIKRNVEQPLLIMDLNLVTIKQAAGKTALAGVDKDKDAERAMRFTPEVRPPPPL